MADRIKRRLDSAPSWAVGLGLALAVVAVDVSTPFVVSWLWPGVDSTAMMLGGLFLGMVLGGTGVVGFLSWHWRVRR